MLIGGHKVWLLSLALLLVVALFAQTRGKRLILKDGSYQLATKWEVHGPRLRFLSAERDEWEEIPYALVDWAATDKYNQDLESGAAEEALPHLSPEEQAERAAEAVRAPLVAPGVRLPDSGGVYLLDEFKGSAELVELEQSGGNLRKNVGHNILRATINPLATSRQTIELPGARAHIQAHQNQPVIFLSLEESDAAATGDAPADRAGGDSASPPPRPPLAPAERFRIVRLRAKKDSRVVGSLKVAFYGKVSQEAGWRPAKIEPLTSRWLKLTPAAPLAPGEYALVELLGKNQINLDVWDFGVDPSAPENAAAWSAAPPQPAPAATSARPVLEQRPH